MGGSLGLGRIAGVRVQVHWSVLVIVALIAWGLSVGALPSAYPGYPTGGYVLAGIVAAVVFMVGLLAHEVSHSVVARRNGIDVDSITLWLFGGVAQLKGQPGDPGTELKVAGVGPLVSLLVGALFGALAWAGGTLGLSRLAVGTLAWLAAINVLLAVFNVLPAAPLDGGRLLKAALWRWRGDRQWATVTSARAGRVLGVALIALGLWQLFATGDLSALWLALVGWFVAGAATVEEQRARTDAALDEVPVAGPDEPVPALMERIGRAADGRVLVLADGDLVGIVSPSDLTRLIERAGLRGWAASGPPGRLDQPEVSRPRRAWHAEPSPSRQSPRLPRRVSPGPGHPPCRAGAPCGPVSFGGRQVIHHRMALGKRSGRPFVAERRPGSGCGDHSSPNRARSPSAVPQATAKGVLSAFAPTG